MDNDLNPEAVACADMAMIQSSAFPDIPLRHAVRAAIRAYLLADSLPIGAEVPVGSIAMQALTDEAAAFHQSR